MSSLASSLFSKGNYKKMLQILIICVHLTEYENSIWIFRMQIYYNMLYIWYFYEEWASKRDIKWNEQRKSGLVL